eukprot:7378264-Prymnesium_polylepis.1
MSVQSVNAASRMTHEPPHARHSRDTAVALRAISEIEDDSQRAHQLPGYSRSNRTRHSPPAPQPHPCKRGPAPHLTTRRVAPWRAPTTASAARRGTPRGPCSLPGTASPPARPPRAGCRACPPACSRGA